MTLSRLFALAAVLTLAANASADHWTHWRGPLMTGESLDKGLPETWAPETPGKNNLIWKQPYGCRSAPLVMNGRVYINTASESGIQEGEKVVCFDEKTGKVLWEYKFNVFHSDIVSSRLGWTYLTASPELDYVYCESTAGMLFCFDKDGKVIWSRSLTEEYGRVTGYGGRIPSPIYDSGLVIVGMNNSSWGDQGRGGNRYAAFDAKSGEVIWWSEPGGPLKNTHNSTPVVAVINGERLLISGGSDGAVHALQVRTGKKVWTYQMAEGVVNGSPLVVGNNVYIGHGDENLDGKGPGRFVCLDGSQVTNGKPKLVWEYAKGVRFGLANPAYADGKIYAPDDFAKLYCFDAKTGKMLWRYNYGRLSRGSPLIADGKCYIFDVNSNFHVLQLNDDEEPEELSKTYFRDTTGLGFVETNCTPVAVNGRLYFATRDDLFCVGKPETMAGTVQYPPMPKEADGGKEPAWIQLLPADVVLKSGEKLQFTMKAFNKLGQELDVVPTDPKWTLPTPPVPPMAKQGPPPLNGEFVDGVLTVNAMMPAQQGYADVTFGDKLRSRARVRVAPQIPYSNDFEKTPEGAAPGGWINAQGKYVVTTLNGNKVLMKTNQLAGVPLMRANAYITLPSSTGYTVECDVMAPMVHDKLPDMGLIVNRYTFVLDGKKDSSSRRVRIGAWEAMPRIKKDVDFDWKPETWYTLKFTVDVLPGNKAVARGKIWERGQKEPEAWTVEFEDPNALASGHGQGSAAIYGFVTNALPGEPGSPIYYDNLKVTPNAK